ncbi:hypothetical protein ABH15_10200 [Methanoculleus taiwanensis]|uniref:TIGR04255 family protein n=1 Tax=Methanoculleus taiwanensis TaxID=1550565 RepID=A0A498H2V9_9EURY|nr:TIGR04255 family protein [Methanoculleus taiwanensis]RXE56440.1 hypothetical protein ABH15_10200 [Methanoculleus taiwanensis]
MRRNVYANPPISEAVCEFRFPLDMPWDMTFPGILFENMKGTYPKRDQRWVREVVVMLGPEGLREELLVTERSMLSTEDGTCALQVGPRLFSVNCQKPHADWDELRPRIENAYSRFRDVIGVPGIRTLNLRYINTIEIPEEEIALGDYFSFYPTFPETLKGLPVGFISGAEFSFEEGRDNCRVELTDAVAEAPGTNAFLLNIDYYLTEEGEIAPDDVMMWIGQAHERVETIFEACITDRLRSLFGRRREEEAVAAR